MPTSDGAFVVNEPQGSPGWYPSNDNPRDKATTWRGGRAAASAAVSTPGMTCSFDVERPYSH